MVGADDGQETFSKTDLPDWLKHTLIKVTKHLKKH